MTRCREPNRLRTICRSAQQPEVWLPEQPGTPLSGPSSYIHWKSASSPLSTSPIHSVVTEP